VVPLPRCRYRHHRGDRPGSDPAAVPPPTTGWCTCPLPSTLNRGHHSQADAPDPLLQGRVRQRPTWRCPGRPEPPRGSGGLL